MIQRLYELQSQSRSDSARNLPQAEGTRTSAEEEEEEARRDRAGECSWKASTSGFKPSSLLGSAQKNGGCSGSGSSRLVPDFVFQASPNVAPRETEGGGGKRQAVKENGRKAKQKLNFTTPTSSCRAEEAEEAQRSNATSQQANSTSWSEMSSMVIGSDYRLLPLSPAMEQRLILQYLTPLGDYQEVRPASDRRCHLKTLL